jgi:hypothetical protein
MDLLLGESVGTTNSVSQDLRKEQLGIFPTAGDRWRDTGPCPMSQTQYDNDNGKTQRVSAERLGHVTAH